MKNREPNGCSVAETRCTGGGDGEGELRAQGVFVGNIRNVGRGTNRDGYSGERCGEMIGGGARRRRSGAETTLPARIAPGVSMTTRQPVEFSPFAGKTILRRAPYTLKRARYVIRLATLGWANALVRRRSRRRVRGVVVRA